MLLAKARRMVNSAVLACQTESGWRAGDPPERVTRLLAQYTGDLACGTAELVKDAGTKTVYGAALGSFGDEVVPEMAGSFFYAVGHGAVYFTPIRGLAAARDFGHGAGSAIHGAQAGDGLRTLLGVREMAVTMLPFVKFSSLGATRAGSRPIPEERPERFFPAPEKAPTQEEFFARVDRMRTGDSIEIHPQVDKTGLVNYLNQKPEEHALLRNVFVTPEKSMDSVGPLVLTKGEARAFYVPRVLMRRAEEKAGATRLIYHNHPSDFLEPSVPDYQLISRFTVNLRWSGSTLIGGPSGVQRWASTCYSTSGATSVTHRGRLGGTFDPPNYRLMLEEREATAGYFPRQPIIVNSTATTVATKEATDASRPTFRAIENAWVAGSVSAAPDPDWGIFKMLFPAKATSAGWAATERGADALPQVAPVAAPHAF